MKKKKDITTFEEYLDKTYGKIGTRTRADFDIKAKSFAIGEIIKEERKNARMTQEELAQQVGVTRQTIIALEAKKYLPSLGLAIRIARVFGVSVEDVFILEEK